MKSLAFGIAGALLVLMAAGLWGGSQLASADGGPHQKDQPSTTDACAGCHRAHTAKAAYLLKANEEQLCLTCHDGTGATTNVRDGVALDAPGGSIVAGVALRGGGFLNARIDSDDDTWRFSVACTAGGGPGSVPGYPTYSCPSSGRITFTGSGTVVPASPTDSSAYWTSTTYKTPGSWPLTIGVLGAGQPVTSRHTIGVGSQTVWGSGAVSATPFAGDVLGSSTKLECSSCHNQHGNGMYRVLRPNPASMVGLTGAFPAGVTVPDDCPTNVTGLSLSGTQATSCIADAVPTPTPGTRVHSYTTDNYMNATYLPWTTGAGGVTPVPCVVNTRVPGYNGTIASSSNCVGGLFQPTSLPHIACTPGAGVPGYPAGYTCPSTGSGAGWFAPNLDGMWPAVVVIAGTPTATGAPASPMGISAWCAQCHQRYLGASVWDKDSGDGVFAFRHTGLGTLAYNGRQCVTCHVAHGTNALATGANSASVEAPGGGAWPGDSGTVPAVITPQSSRLLKMDNRGMCLKCHKVP